MHLPPKSVDTERLPEQDAKELAGLVKAAEAAGAPAEDQPGMARDAMSYKVLIEDEGGPVYLRAKDTAMSREFAALLEWLERHAQPAD